MASDTGLTRQHTIQYGSDHPGYFWERLPGQSKHK